MVDAYFVGIAILTIGTSILALESKELIYGAIALAISLLGIAGFFLLLDSPFVAMFQITVYVGAVAVLVIFTVMLVRTQDLFTIKDDKGRKGRRDYTDASDNGWNWCNFPCIWNKQSYVW
jgi:NADH:ubiquinone oxidoreductase subunit 6 (chain J)